MSEFIDLEISGRCGRFVFERDGVLAEAYVEMSGSKDFDLLVDLNQMTTWSNGVKLSPQDKDMISSAFKALAEKRSLSCQW